jgi:hypothetical protein
MRLLVLLFQICCLTATAVGQSFVLPKSPLQQRTTGAGGQDELLSLTTNWRGDIAAIGNATKGKEGGQDISLVIFDRHLTPVIERHIGRRGDDGAGQIAVLPDGRYIIAGYSTKPSGRNKTRANYLGKKDGWLLVLNERGETEKEILLGSPENDAFVAVTVAPDGSIWAAGNAEKQAWLVHLDASFNLLWERRLQHHNLPTQVNAAVLTPAGEWFLAGGIEELGRKHLWVAGFDTKGTSIMEKIYPNSQAEIGTGIAVVNDETLAIVGNVEDPSERENSFLTLLSRTGVMSQYTPLGGREFDHISTVLRLSSGQLLAGGGSASFERGSRRISAWLPILNTKGENATNHYYGSKLDDEVLALAEHSDGRLFAVGTTARQVLKMRQGWLFQLSETAPESKLSANEINPILQELHYPTGHTMSSTERSWLPFSLKNTSAEPIYKLRAVISPQDKKLTQWLPNGVNSSVFLSPVGPQETLNWGLPVRFSAGCPSGLHAFQVQFFSGEKPISAAQPFTVQVGENIGPKLSLRILPIDSGLVLGQSATLRFEIHNTGDQAAQGLNLSSSVVAGVQLPTQLALGDLAAGSRQTYQLPIQADHIAVGPKALPLSLRIADGSLTHTATAETTLSVRSASGIGNAVTNQYTVAVWVYPNPDNFDKKTLVWPQEDITVQVKIVSTQPITRQQFCIEINGEPCQVGAKFDEVQVKGDRNSKTFSQTISLRQGQNSIQAVIQTPNGSIQSEPLQVVFTPAKPNLHIVSIGIPAADLKYTSKDARDFALMLASQSNTAFGNVFLDTLLTEERTTKTEILKTLRRLQYRYTDLQILPKDLLVIFVSGHGLGAYDGSFRLAASDYDGPFLQETSLDFEQELINYLQSLPCQKIFFVDACHSGTTTGTGLAGIASRKNGLNMIVSCQPDEYSYEDDNWQNGAFTRALVRGMEDFKRQPKMLDRNTDAALDISELFGFIQREVPDMVEKKRPKSKTAQQPKLILANPGQPAVLFRL